GDAIVPPQEFGLHPPPTAPRMEPPPAAPDAAAARGSIGSVADEPFPCAGCGYDLRGRPSGARCPECGAVIPKRRRTLPLRGARTALREELQSAWLTLGWTALAPVALLTPLPCLLPFGAVVPICVGFAPAFRLVVVRHFAGLPDDLRHATAPAARALRAFAMIELAFAGLLALCAAGMTFGLASGLATAAYLPLVVLWWGVAALALRGQLEAGTTFAAALVDPSVLPREGVRRARLALAIAAPIGIAGTAMIAAGFAAGAGWSSPLSILGALAALAACVAFTASAVFARSHAEMVASCVLECEALRERDFRLEPRLDPHLDAADTDDPAVKALLRRTDAARKPADDDDAPIPLS
ncbi:MAG: hypothetical protein ACKO0W_03455, partial [Planctomycetota bacterium]